MVSRYQKLLVRTLVALVQAIQVIEAHFMNTMPLWKNTALLTTLAVVAALGAVVRIFVKIPIIPEVVELTPGFAFSLLGGVIGGVSGGALVGAIVGLAGALAGGEVPLLPMIGNICLGLGSGIAIHLAPRDTLRYTLSVVLGGGIIGGFLPTLLIFSSVIQPLAVNLVAAAIDMWQAMVWAVLALIIDQTIIRPIAGRHLYDVVQSSELSHEEVSSQ